MTIGVISSDSGGNQTGTNTGVQDTVNSWQSWTNSHGGVNGHPVKVIYDNDNSDPAQSTADAKGLISAGVVAIMDNSLLSTSWASAVTAAHVPVIGLQDSSDTFTELSQPDFFPTGMTVDTTIAGQQLVAKEAGYTTWGQAYCTGEAVTVQAAHLKAALGPKLGVNVVSNVPTLCPSPNYVAQCLVAKNANAQAFFPAGPPIAFIDDCVRQGYHPHWIYSTTFTNNLLTDKNTDGAIGNVGVIPWFATGTPALTTFHQATHNLANTAANPGYVIATWVGLQAFRAAATRVSASATATASDILTGLYGFHDETLGGLTGPLTYIQGQPTRNPCYYVVGVNNGAFTAPLGVKPFCLTADQQKVVDTALGLEK